MTEHCFINIVPEFSNNLLDIPFQPIASSTVQLVVIDQAEIFSLRV